MYTEWQKHTRQGLRLAGLLALLLLRSTGVVSAAASRAVALGLLLGARICAFLLLGCVQRLGLTGQSGGRGRRRLGIGRLAHRVALILAADWLLGLVFSARGWVARQRVPNEPLGCGFVDSQRVAGRWV